MKIVITGANGQLGLALARRLSLPALDHVVIALDRASLDIADEAACRAAVAKHAPDIVLNCAAYTAVDRAESDRESAFSINATGAENLAKACAATNTFLVHFSTDYVFNGQGSRPYVETDATAPLGVYGVSKLAGERAVQTIASSFAILRLSWVYSNDGANFYKTMLRLTGERDVLRVVADQFGTPNFTGDIAEAIACMLSRSANELRLKSGVYHLSGNGVASWHEFASEIVVHAQLARRPTVEAITTADFPTPARRPAYSALDASRFATTFGWTIPKWRDGLTRCLAERAL